MATKKPAPKKAKPVKKAVPVKKTAKPASKPVAKKAVKPAPKSKPAAKKVVKPTPKPVAKKTVKPAPKPAAKKVVKPAPKPAAKKVVPPAKKVAVKPASKTPIKPAQKQVTKKIEPVKPVAVAKPAPVVAKPAAKVAPAPPSKPVKKPLEPIKDVKVPKIASKGSVPYNPGYTSLEKRTQIAKPNEPLVRYSDTELNEFRELINKKLETSKKELAYLQGLITRKDEMGGDETENRYMTMEDGSMSMEREQLSQMASRQITYIDHLEKAIMRIENKTYGICRVTGKLIDKARLRAVPHATLSLEAKLGLVKSPNEQ
jgi:RNA polymerase-binding transcription factor DksA